MKSICLSLAAAATFGLVIAAPASYAAPGTPGSAPAVRATAGPVAPPRIAVPRRIELPNPAIRPKGITRRKVTSLAQLPPSLRAQIQRRLRPYLKKRMASLGIVSRGGSNAAPPTEEELDLTCDEWFILYEEDKNGDPVPGTAKINCDGVDV